jgi:serine/threonine-protein kinase HipA
VVNGWRPHFAACGVTDADLDSLAERIDGEQLLRQRQTFNPADHATPTLAQRRRSPFAK